MHLHPVCDPVWGRSERDGQSFALPHQVIDDSSLELASKRVIVAELASDGRQRCRRLGRAPQSTDLVQPTRQQMEV